MVHLPINISREVLLIEIGAGICSWLSLWYYVTTGCPYLGTLVVAVAVQALTSKVGTGATIAYVHVGLARWLWAGGSISWVLAAASALVLSVTAYVLAVDLVVERLTEFNVSCLPPSARLVLMTASASVVLLWMPWVTAAAWGVVTVLRAVALSYESGRVLLMLAKELAEVHAALGRGKAEEEEHRRERRLALVTNHLVPHYTLRLDEASKYLTAKIAAGWTEGRNAADAADGKDSSSATWRECAMELAATTAALPGRSLLGMGLVLAYTSAPSWLYWGVVLLTLTPRLGSLHWGCKVGRDLVRNACCVIDLALSCMFPLKNAPTPVCTMRRGCRQPPPVQRQSLKDLFEKRVGALLAGMRQWESTQEEDYKWLCGEVANHETEADEVFEARLQGGAGEIVSVLVLRRDYTYTSGKSTFNRALCLSFDHTRVYVVPCGSLLKAEAPPAQFCRGDREAVAVEPTAADLLEQYRRRVDEAKRKAGSDLNIATTLGLMEVGDVEEQTKEWLSTSSAGEALNRRLAMVSTAAKDRSVYAAKDVAKWVSTAGGLLTYSVRSRASATNAQGSLVERMSLAGHLYAACPVWREAFSTVVPVFPELQQDTIVLGKAAINAIRVPLSETMSEEAAGLGYVATDATELIVPASWDTDWDEDQVGHAAGVVREYLVEAQAKLLKRLWDAHGLSATLPAVAEGGSSVWQEAWGEPRAERAERAMVGTGGSASTTEGAGTGGSGSGGMERPEPSTGGGAATSGGAGSGGATTRGGDGEDEERHLTLRLLQQLSLQASGLAINATGRGPTARSVIEQADEARLMRRRLFTELTASSAAQMVSSNIGVGGCKSMIGRPLSGVRATDDSDLATLAGVQHSILSGRPFTSPLPADNYTFLLEERASRASTVRHISTHPICAPCTLEKVLEERKATNRDLSAPVSDEEWNRNLHHVDTPDAVYCHSSDHSWLSAKGSGKVYCAPPPGIPTPCGVCGVIQFHAGRPRTNCTSCGVPYFAVHTSEFKVERPVAEKLQSFSAKDQAAGTGAMMGGGGGSYSFLSGCKRPDVAQERLCTALRSPCPELKRFRWHALTVYCLIRCIFNLHPEFKRDFQLESGGRRLLSSSFNSIEPERDTVYLHVRWFQTNDGRDTPLVVERSAKQASSTDVPTTLELRAMALKEAKDTTVEDWQWRKEGTKADYSRGVQEMLSATQNCIEACIGVYGEGYREDFESAYLTLKTMLMSESFGADLGRAEFQCNLLFADWSRRVRGHFNGSAVGKSYLYQVEIDAGAAVPRPLMSYGLEGCLEMANRLQKRAFAAHAAALYSRGEECSAVGGPSPSAKVSGSLPTGPSLRPRAEGKPSRPPTSPLISVKTLGSRSIKPALLEKEGSLVEAGRVCYDFLTNHGCSKPNCCLAHVFPTAVSYVEFAYALPRGGLRGLAQVSLDEMRSVTGGLKGSEPEAEVVRRYLETVHRYMQPGGTILDITPIEKRLTTIVSQPLLRRMPQPVTTRGGMLIVNTEAVGLGHGKSILYGTSVDVGSEIGLIGSQCVVRALAAQLEPLAQSMADCPSCGDLRECGDNRAVRLREEILQQLGDLDPARLKVDSEVAASYVSCVDNAKRGLPENILDLVAPQSLDRVNILVVSVTGDTVVYRYYPAGGTHNGAPVPAGLVGNPKQYNEQAGQSETIAVLCRPAGSRGETRHCTVLKVNKLRHQSLIHILDRFDKCSERVYVAVLHRGGLGPLGPRLVPGSAPMKAIEAARNHFHCLGTIGGIPRPEVSGTSGSTAALDHALRGFRKEFASALSELQGKLNVLEGMPHPPDPCEYKSALRGAEETCYTYFSRLTALARDGQMGMLVLDGRPVTPERLALVSMRHACVQEFYDGWAGEKGFWEESAERVMDSVLPGHAAALDEQMRAGDRSHFLGDPEGVWNENHPSADGEDQQRALIRDVVKQAALRRGLLFDTSCPKTIDMLLAGGVRKSPLATTGKRCEDGRPAIEAHWGIPKFRPITDATNRCDPQAPNAGISMYSHVVQQTTDLEQMVLSILRIETPGGLLEASKEDIADAFRLIVTADVDFGNIAYGVLDTLYVPMTLAFGLRHSPSAFEVLSRAVLDVYHRTRDCGEAGRFDACERFVDDFVQITNCSASETPAGVLRNKLRGAIRDVCGPSGLNAEKSSGEGRTELPIFGVYFDFVKRRVYPNAYKVHDFVEEARAFVDGTVPHLTLQQASRLQGLGNFLFQASPGLMGVFQSRLSAMLSKEEEARYKKSGIPPSPAFKHEDDRAGWEALRRSLRAVCMLVKWRESRLLVKPFEAGLKMPQRLMFPGREMANNLYEIWSDSAGLGSCGVDSSTGKGIRFEFTKEENKLFALAQRRWDTEIGGDARCINYRELHAAVATSVLTAPDHVGGIVRYAIDNQAAAAWLAASGTDLNHVAALLELNGTVNFLLGIDSCSRYVKTSDNTWMDAGSRYDAEAEFARQVQRWEAAHPGKQVEWMQVPRFLREFGSGTGEARYQSSAGTWEVMSQLMEFWRDNGIGPFGKEELDELHAMFSGCARGDPLPAMPAPGRVSIPDGPSAVRVELSTLNHSRNSLLRKLQSGGPKRPLEGDPGSGSAFVRVNAIMQHQWERCRDLLRTPVRNDHTTTFQLPEIVPRDRPGGIRLCESYCGQGAMGKALKASGGGELVVYAETDPWCRAHLARVFPQAKALNDHRQITARVLRHYRVNLFACGPPCPNHSIANPHRRGGTEGTGRYYADCASAAIEARVHHILVECTPGVNERNGCETSPLDQLQERLRPLYHVQVLKVDTPRVKSPYSGYVAPVHHSRLYVVATLKAFRQHPMTFAVESDNVLATDASSIFGQISLDGECEAMPVDDVRQLQRENRRGGGGTLQRTVQYVGRVAGTQGNHSPSHGMYRDLVFDPLRGLMPTFTGAGGSGWASVLQDGLTVVRKPTLREAAAAYGLRYLDEELNHPCEGLQSAIGNSIPGPVAEAFVAQVLQDRGRNATRSAFLDAWGERFGEARCKSAVAVPPHVAMTPASEPPQVARKPLPPTCSSGGPTGPCVAPKLSKGISKLCGPGGTVDPTVLRKVRSHVTSVMRAGINLDSQSRYASSLKVYYEFSDLVGRAPLYRRVLDNGAEGRQDAHLLFQHHIVEYLAFCNVVNGNCAGTLRSKLSHISWAHTSSGLDDPLKKHHATYLEAWMRALERREPKSAAGKRPATPSLLLMARLVISQFAEINPVYYLAMSAAVDTAWCFMLRSREYLAVPEKGSNPMRWGQIVFRNERGDEVRGTEVGMAERITLRLPSTKNDLGHPTRSVRRTNEPVCCVQSLINLYSSLQRRADGEKLLAPDAPVFVGGVDGSPLRREDVNLVLELSAKELYGADNSKLFRSHSLRHGGASAYAAAGVPLHVIKEFGRWKSEAYMIYITLSVDVLDSHIRKAQAQALVLEERK